MVSILFTIIVFVFFETILGLIFQSSPQQIFDNQIHESTGGQITNSKNIDLEKIAQSTNYKTFVAKEKKELECIFKKIKFLDGPIFIKIKISRSTKIGKRIDIEPVQIKSRFQESLI